MSYTRDRGSLTRPDDGLNCRDGDFSQLAGLTNRPRFRPIGLPLTAAALQPILESPETNERR
ncbi:hypothetical protein SAMN05216338_101778 [Bradyrhizobium sp. Rc2d]|nr:hypothetical protein SAMN05216338_101778 [Bradyrhizobium sp. Rc2d]